MTGRIFPHVPHVGSAFPSGPFGTSGLAVDDLATSMWFRSELGRVRSTLVSGSSFTALSFDGVLAGVETRLLPRPFDALRAEDAAEARTSFLVPDEDSSSTGGGVATSWLHLVELLSIFPFSAAIFCRRVAMIDLKEGAAFRLETFGLSPEEELSEDMDDSGGPSGGVIRPFFRELFAQDFVEDLVDETDVRSEEDSSSSISPSIGVPLALGNGGVVSSSSLSSESSSCSCTMAYTPLRVLRSLRLTFDAFLTLAPSPSSESDSDSDPERSSPSE